MVIQIVKFESALSEEEVMAMAKEREPQFRAMRGLLQKYYIKIGQSNQFGGIYIWDSMESLSSYRESELAASIAKAYKATGPPTVEIYEGLFQLRE